MTEDHGALHYTREQREFLVFLSEQLWCNHRRANGATSNAEEGYL
jgi:hypothetical protein